MPDEGWGRGGELNVSQTHHLPPAGLGPQRRGPGPTLPVTSEPTNQSTSAPSREREKRVAMDAPALSDHSFAGDLLDLGGESGEGQPKQDAAVIPPPLPRHLIRKSKLGGPF